MKIAVQMDDISQINIKGDSSFALMLEAQNRDFEIYYYRPSDMMLEGDQLFAWVCKLKLRDEVKNHYQIIEAKKINLKIMDIILLRQDPPFNMNYITTTHLLDFIKQDVLVLNDPFWVRNCPEKLFVMQFSQYMPKTLITSKLEDAQDFRDKIGGIIVKPLYGNGGAGVFFLKKQDKNLNSLVELFQAHYKEPYIVQEFLPDISKGDCRIILIDGEIAGAINRVADKDQIRSNMHVGGTAHHIELNSKQIEICNAIKPWLKERNLFLVGLDIIGDKVTEINVTSPTGLREIKAFTNNDPAKIFWDKAVKKLEEFQVN